MGREFYDNNKFDVEHILNSPVSNDISAAAGELFQINFTEAIELTEFGFYVVTALSDAGGVPTIEIRIGSTVLGTISIPTGTAAGTLITTVSLTTTLVNAGTDLIFYRNATNTGAGDGHPYIKYRERYV